MSRRRYHSSEMSLDPKYARTLIGSGHYLAAVLYERGIDHADDWGRLRGDVAQFMLTVLPSCRETDEVIEEALNAVTAAGLWARYEVDGKTFIQYPIVSFHRIQSYIAEPKRREDFSEFPPPPDFPLPHRERHQGNRADLNGHLRTSAAKTAQKSLQVTSDNLGVPSPSPSPSPSLTEEVGSRGESEGGMFHPLTGPTPGPTSGLVTEADEILGLLVKLGCVRSTQNLAAVRLVVQKLPSVAALEVALDHYRWQEPMPKKERLKDQIHGWQKAMQRAYEGNKYQRTPTPPSRQGLKERPPPTGEEREVLRRRAAAQEARANASA